MRLSVRYFASIREVLGPGETVEAPQGADVAAVRDLLINLSPRHAQALARHRAVRCALDHGLCEESARVREGAELAFFPPVTGG